MEITGRVEAQIDEGILTAEYIYIKAEKSHDGFDPADDDIWEFNNVELETENDIINISKISEAYNNILIQEVIDNEL